MTTSPEIQKRIKCVVWDLDGTIWDGILIETCEVRLRPGIRRIIETLDHRGILHSIASRNSHRDAVCKLEEVGLMDYFLYPEINWNAKSASIASIAENLNIHTDSILFVDDDPRERDEVNSVYPYIRCIDASHVGTLLDLPCLNPRFITEDSKRRRQMYRSDVRRRKAEEEFQGPRKEFLATLNIQLGIADAQEDDLERAEELTVRTNQLNTTGRTYGYTELKELMGSSKYRLIMCHMKDKYGDHGNIGLALVEVTEDCLWLRLLLMSCRVMSLGVGTVLLSYIMQDAKKAGKTLRADFRDTGRNRIMYITFMFANFKQVGKSQSGNVILESDLSSIQAFPPYMRITVE